MSCINIFCNQWNISRLMTLLIVDEIGKISHYYCCDNDVPIYFSVVKNHLLTMPSAVVIITRLLIVNLLLPSCLCSCNNILSMADISALYCNHSGVTIPWLVSFHECRWLCIQKSTCTATNYNISENTCTLLSAPCPQTTSDMTMGYTMFSNTPRDQCLEWIDYTPGMPRDMRWAQCEVRGEDLHRVVARLTYRGDIYPGYMTPLHRKCFGTDGSRKFSKNYACQLLRVKDGCTMRFVLYTAGDIMPPDAVSIRSLSDDKTRYIVIVQPAFYPGKYIGGYYTYGAPTAFCAYGGVRQESQMQLLILMW